MNMTLKAISALLSYPSEDLKKTVPEIAQIFDQNASISDLHKQDLWPLMTRLACDDLITLQETYVGLFDRSRTISLNLFEHVHGESRDRGGAMVDLIETYRDAGFEPVSSELPDHLPVLLEYLAMREFGEAQEVLADAAHILQAIQKRLVRRESDYAGVFATLVALSGASADQEKLAELMSVPDVDPNDLEALDAVWEESEVTFGPDPNAGCPQVRDILANMDTPINTPSGRPTAAE